MAFIIKVLLFLFDIKVFLYSSKADVTVARETLSVVCHCEQVYTKARNKLKRHKRSKTI